MQTSAIEEQHTDAIIKGLQDRISCMKIAKQVNSNQSYQHHHYDRK